MDGIIFIVSFTFFTFQNTRSFSSIYLFLFWNKFCRLRLIPSKENKKTIQMKINQLEAITLLFTRFIITNLKLLFGLNYFVNLLPFFVFTNYIIFRLKPCYFGYGGHTIAATTTISISRFYI